MVPAEKKIENTPKNIYKSIADNCIKGGFIISTATINTFMDNRKMKAIRKDIRIDIFS